MSQAMWNRFTPAAGSEFSVLKPDNPTGNFTKVVQRIAVRITIDPNQKRDRKSTPWYVGDHVGGYRLINQH